ncbi:hypothetical protein PO124_12975 [Bacillus licheniformis]|nr:hypothetical protein [Bacillus licheniformis]
MREREVYLPNHEKAGTISIREHGMKEERRSFCRHHYIILRY